MTTNHTTTDPENTVPAATAFAPSTATEFGAFLKERWAKLDLHQAEFCRLVDSPAGWVQQIREGRKTPPLSRMPEWSAVLQLVGPERQWFLDLAAIQHLPEEARRRFTTLAFHAFAGAKP